MTSAVAAPLGPPIPLPMAGTSGAVCVTHAPIRHAWFPSSPCGDHCRAVDRDLAVAGPMLVAFRVVRLVMVAVWLISAGVVVTVLPRIVRRRFLQRASRSLLAAIGVTIRVDDHRPFTGNTRGLIVANHVSYLDILALAVINPAHFVAKSDVGRMPVVAGLARRLGVILIERESLRALPSAVAEAVAGLHQDDSVAVFPEGTTWCGRESGHFRPAFFQAAIDAGVPVIPVRLRFTTPGDETTAVASFIGDDGPADTLGRVLRMRGLTVHIRVHEVQLPGTDRRALATRCERLVAA